MAGTSTSTSLKPGKTTKVRGIAGHHLANHLDLIADLFHGDIGREGGGDQ